MRKKVIGKVLSVVLAAALALSPAGEVVAASADELIEISSLEEAEIQCETEDEETESEEEIEVISEEAGEELADQSNEVVVDEEIVDSENPEETSDSAEFEAVQEIPSGATQVGEPRELGTNVMGQLYQWTSGKEKHTALYIYSPNNAGIEISKKTATVFSDKYKSITDLIIAADVNSIETRAFEDCVALKNVAFPERIESIGQYAFQGCINLKSFVIPKTVKTAYSDIFSGCTSLTEVTFEDGMTVIPNRILQSYWGKGYVTKVNIPSTVVKIGELAFQGQGSLKTVNFEGDKLTEIQDNAFEGTAIETIELADGIRSIGTKAFRNCSKLKTLDLPADLETIGQYAFQGCNSLKSVVIPKKVKTAYSDIFSSCTLLTEVTFEEGMTVIPAKILQSYWDKGYVTTVNIPSTVVTIGELAFQNQGSLKTVNFEGDRLTEIQDGAFEGTAIEEIELADGIKSIGSKAFKNCSKLKTLDLPENLQTIGQYAFQGCSSLKSVLIPKSVKFAYSDIFSSCTSLAEVSFEEGMTVIPEKILQSYWDKGYVTTVNIPSTVVSIGELAFQNQTSLRTVNFAGNRLTEIQASAFEGTAIEEIKLANGIKSIGSKAFQNCSSLKTIDLPDNLETFGQYAFNGCSSLKSVVIPKSVKTAYSDIFSGCTALTDVTFEDGMTVIPERMLEAFWGKNYITTVFIPASVVSIGEKAFSDNDSLKTVYYRGTKASREKMSIASKNDALLNANWVYISKSVTGLTIDTKNKNFNVDDLKTEESKVFTVKATINPSNADITTVSATKNNIKGKAVSSVKQTGKNGNDTSFEVKLTGKAGESLITFTSMDGAFVATCKVTVVSKDEPIIEDPIDDPSDDPSDNPTLKGEMKNVKVAGLSTTVSYTGRKLVLSDLFNKNDKTAKKAGWNAVTLYVVNSKTKEKTLLVEGRDFEFVSDDNYAAGKVKVSFVGKGDFTGRIDKTVTIKALNAAKDFNISVGNVTYTKAGVKPSVTVTYAGKKLVAGTDYTVTYKNIKKAELSTAKKAPYVVVKAKGNYAGTSKKVTFTIGKADVSALKMQAKDVTFKANGKKGYFLVKPTFTDNDKNVSIGKNKDINVKYTYTYAEETTLKDGTKKHVGDTVDPKDKLVGPTSIQIKAEIEAGGAKSSYKGTTTKVYKYRVK